MGLRLDVLLILFRSLLDPQTLRWVVWAGTGGLSVWLLVLMRTRWGQFKPLWNCALLSVLAHLLAAVYTLTLPLSVGGTAHSPSKEATMRVSAIEEFSDADGVSQQASPDQPWEKFSDSALAPDPFDLERPNTQPLTEMNRAQPNDLAAMPSDPELPAAPLKEFKADDSQELAADTVERPTAPAESTEPIDAPQAMRRNAPAEAAPARPELPRDATSAADIAENAARASSREGMPSKLLEQPALPPQLADAPVIDDTAPLLLGKKDKLSRGGTPAAADSTSPDGSGDDSAATDEMVAVDSGRTADNGGAAAVASLINGSGTAGSAIDGAAPSGLPPAVSRAARGAAGQNDEIALPTGPSRTIARSGRDANPQAVPELYQARTAPDRTAAASVRGGNRQTEGAVQAALAWLADAQSRDGRWDADRFGAGREGKVLGRDRKGAGADADTGITGLALLAFLGAGQTHRTGDYQETVRHGLEFLISQQEKDGNLGGGASLYAFMYCHGMASCALSEAYTMTHDDRLERPVRRAIGFTLKAQHPTNGGWRYKAGDPQGDTSQFGWQLMALKSAELGGIRIPEQSREGMVAFLKSVASGEHGGLASYRAHEKTSRTMTAEALVCRQFLGMSRDNPASDEAGDYILTDLPGESEPNFYYWYYGTLAMYQLQGEHWDRWNAALKKSLLESQQNEGSELGSWDPDPIWGKHGGRVYSTAMAALCLEVYYRYLPLYTHASRPQMKNR